MTLTPINDLAALLKQEGASLSVAESCTGGFLSSAITDFPGSSDFFIGGITPYSSEHKTKLMGVKSSILKHKGPVSKEVSESLAMGAVGLFGSTYSIAITGYLPPSEGDPYATPGTYYVSIYKRGRRSPITKRFFVSDGLERDGAKKEACIEALNMLIDEIKE